MTQSAPCASGGAYSASSWRRAELARERGWEAAEDGLRLGVHERGAGPGDTGSLPYFTVNDMAAALERVRELGGSIVPPG